jgi:hypothetical protein
VQAVINTAVTAQGQGASLSTCNAADPFSTALRLLTTHHHHHVDQEEGTASTVTPEKTTGDVFVSSALACWDLSSKDERSTTTAQVGRSVVDISVCGVEIPASKRDSIVKFSRIGASGVVGGDGSDDEPLMSQFDAALRLALREGNVALVRQLCCDGARVWCRHWREGLALVDMARRAGLNCAIKSRSIGNFGPMEVTISRIESKLSSFPLSPTPPVLCVSETLIASSRRSVDDAWW